ncbi:Acidic amino acid decarboxylase GADL1 [Holothuria leucospilota]|uniref:Acidic amino acid decarboxylase GADL1 n=1 Tax=Holothuria leucospilota TaxID=206669 RepID=A0A9Q1C0C4_HOLLE|nr:Acidic amino acid decarboxylase GADL1 [Holothuria leucospilota]
MNRSIAVSCCRVRCKFGRGWRKCSGPFQLTFKNQTSLHLSSSASALPPSHHKNPLVKMDEMEQCHKHVNVSSLKDANNNENTSFLRDVFEIIAQDVLIKGKIEDTKVIDFKYPEELKKQVDLDIQDRSLTEEEMLSLCKFTVNNSVRSTHPFFNNQLWQGVDVVGLAGLYLVHALKTSIYTYEMAPLFSLIENAILEKIRRLCGFEEGDGIFCPGGSMCNMYAINLARYHMNPDVKRKGVRGYPQSVMFASDVSHYSVIKGASFMGIGCENIFEVKSDDGGRMIPEELEVAIVASKEKGDAPLIVVATSGTTVQGAYDPLDKLADVCEKYGVWLHVDAAWGGSALLSRKHKHKMKGVERVDSLAWCLHKMLGVPLQCSALVLNKKGDLLKQCHSSAATYLFQADKFYGAEYDTGDKSIQCARLPDAFKAWFMWKAKGDKLVEEEIDYKFEMARTCSDLIRNRQGFRLLWEPDCTNVCFWYIPPCLRHLPDGPELWERLSKFAPLLKQKMMTSGQMMITYQPLKDKVNFWRMVFSNSEFQHQHLLKMLDDFERLAKDIEV